MKPPLVSLAQATFEAAAGPAILAVLHARLTGPGAGISSNWPNALCPLSGESGALRKHSELTPPPTGWAPH